MTLKKDEYRIEDEGIWISKKALEECKNHYQKIAYELEHGSLSFLHPFYLGKAEAYLDLLKHFEPLEL